MSEGAGRHTITSPASPPDASASPPGEKRTQFTVLVCAVSVSSCVTSGFPSASSPTRHSLISLSVPHDASKPVAGSKSTLSTGFFSCHSTCNVFTFISTRARGGGDDREARARVCRGAGAQSDLGTLQEIQNQKKAAQARRQSIGYGMPIIRDPPVRQKMARSAKSFTTTRVPRHFASMTDPRPGWMETLERALTALARSSDDPVGSFRVLRTLTGTCTSSRTTRGIARSVSRTPPSDVAWTQPGQGGVLRARVAPRALRRRRAVRRLGAARGRGLRVNDAVVSLLERFFAEARGTRDASAAERPASPLGYHHERQPPPPSHARLAPGRAAVKSLRAKREAEKAEHDRVVARVEDDKQGRPRSERTKKRFHRRTRRPGVSPRAHPAGPRRASPRTRAFPRTRALRARGGARKTARPLVEPRASFSDAQGTSGGATPNEPDANA